MDISNINNMRVYALSLAHRAVDDIRRDNLRQLRNYVDMCAFLAESSPQKKFFDTAQHVLEKTDSLYYPLIQRLLSTVSDDRICTVGVNFGVDTLICGGAHLKKTAQATGQPVYWLTLAPSDFTDLDAHITEGEAGGCFMYGLFGSDAARAQALAAAHPKSNFVLVMEPEAFTPFVADALRACENLTLLLSLPSPEISDAAHDIICGLRRDSILCGLVVALRDSDSATIFADEWMDILAQNTLLCIYTHKEMSPAAADALYRKLCSLRTTTGMPAILLDWEKDVPYLNRFISPLAGVEDLR